MSRKPLTWKNLVSIVFVLDGENIQFLSNLFKNLRQQTYKNVEYIFVYASHFKVDEFKEQIRKDTDIDFTTKMKFVETEYNHAMFDAGIKEAEGDIIFLKYCQPVLWHPCHIRAHVLGHQQKKMKKSFLLSLLEIKAIEMPPEHPMSTINYRITKKIQPQDILVDEISFTRDVETNFASYCSFVDKNHQNVAEGTPDAIAVFDPVKMYTTIQKQTGTIEFAEEISVIAMVPTRQPQQLISQPNWPNDQLLQVVDEDFSIRECIPTILGNTQLDEQWNNKMRQYLVDHWSELETRKNLKIIVKRTVGMGDVIQTSAFITYLKRTFPSSEIWFITSKSRSCSEIVKTFYTIPDQILAVDENLLLTDLMGYDNLPKLLKETGHPEDIIFDIRIDLDLAYESRLNGQPFVKAYYDTIGVTEDKPFYNLEPDLNIYDYFYKKYGEDFNSRNIAFNDATFPRFLAINLGGSGWPGKELEPTAVDYILTKLSEFGISLIHTSSLPEKYQMLEKHFDWINREENFDKMLAAVDASIGFVGADSGVMHVARALNKPLLVWNGAAITEITANTKDYKNIVVLKKEELACLGCKHRTFYNIIPLENNQATLSFLPKCENPDTYTCMKDFKQATLNIKISDFATLLGVNGLDGRGGASSNAGPKGIDIASEKEGSDRTVALVWEG